MAVTVDLFRDFAQLIRDELNIDSSRDDLDVVRLFAWYDLRRLPMQNWNVHYSRELQENHFFINNKSYIEAIRNKAESGEDLVPHASHRVDDITEKDELLADWGIYHIHPGHGTRPRKSGFVDGAAELLFVLPRGKDLYFIDVLDHKSWTNFSLIEVIDNNWPFLLDPFRLKNVVGLSNEPTEEDLYKLRKNQINAFFRVGKSFFIGPGGGLASDGSASRAVLMSMNLKKLLDGYSKQLKEEEADFRRTVEERTETPLNVDTISLKLLQYDPRTGSGEIYEPSTATVIQFHF
ncbi:MAG: hypothetical protein JJE30_03785 [Desulfuromonadales bacterium]|nr:hypothetical protein [Desulfuromonadales bacterium]